MSGQAQFGLLTDVSARDAWDHEALSLTPWLAANLDRLEEALGLKLELEGIEMPVDRFAADILARDTASGDLVLTENQLEQSDHSHLGQIMTYLAGLEAKVMVWIAPSFREPHLSAIRWLNEHTLEPFSFFAVRLRVVRIGNSPLAPLFEVVERPNGWDRFVGRKAKESREASPAASTRRAFWEYYENRFVNPGLQGGGGRSRWHVVPNSDLVISRWFANDGVGIFVRSGRGNETSQTADRLEPFKTVLEHKLGASIGRSFPFVQKLRIDTSDEKNWAQMADWIHEITLRYEAALLDVAEGRIAS